MKQSKQIAELERRNSQRPKDGATWFIPEEASLAAVLSSLIVPSDRESPGAAEAGVVSTIERLILTSAKKQSLYSQGLYAFEQWARHRYGQPFVKLPVSLQIELLTQADRQYRDWSTAAALPDKIKRKLRTLYFKWNGYFPAVEFFPWLVRDVMQAFYTNEVSWHSLGYDGPPMLLGYPNLRRRSIADSTKPAIKNTGA